MAKISKLIFLGLLIAACSSSDDPTQPTGGGSGQGGTDNPYVKEEIFLEDLDEGETITIEGTFKPNLKYTVGFNGTEGLVKEVKAGHIKVEVPEGITAGDITITFIDSVKVGTFTVGERVKYQFYAHKYNSVDLDNLLDQIVMVNERGEEKVIIDFEKYMDLDEDMVFDPSSGKIIGYSAKEDDLISIDVLTGKMTILTNFPRLGPNESYGDFIAAEGNYLYFYNYHFKDNVKKDQIVKVDYSGKKTVVATPGFQDYFQSAVLMAPANTIYGLVKNEIFSIDLATGTTTRLPLNENEGFVSYEDLTSDKEGNLYAHKATFRNSNYDREIVRIDGPDSETSMGSFFFSYPYTEYETLAFDSSSENAFMIINEKSFLKINTKNGSSRYIKPDIAKDDIYLFLISSR